MTDAPSAHLADPPLLQEGEIPRRRILHVFNRYRYFGGEELVVAKIHRALECHHDVHWLTFDSKDWVGPNAPGILGQVTRTWYNRESREAFLSAVREHQPDAALFHNIYPIGSPSLYHAAWELGLPVLQMMHNYRPFSVGGTLTAGDRPTPESLRGSYSREVWAGVVQGSRIKSAVYALLFSWLHRCGWLSCVRRWLCISDYVKSQLATAGQPATSLVTLRHFWDLSGAPPQPEDAGHYLFLGRLVPSKGITTLLETWKFLERQMGAATPTLKIGGEGPEESAVRHATQHSSKIEFLGFLQGEAKTQAIHQARALVVPSTWPEPLGLVTYEAYEKGKPVLAARAGGLAELVFPGQTGFLHEPGNVTELAQHVLELEGMTAVQRRAMGRHGYDWLRAHASLAGWQRQFSATLESMLGAGSR